MRQISVSDDNTIMCVELDTATMQGGLSVDRRKLISLLSCMQGDVVTLKRYEMRPQVGRTDLYPMDTLLMGDKESTGCTKTGYILAPIE